MSITKAICSTCGKPLEKIPTYLVEGEGAKLFQCDECFYPGCSASRRARGQEMSIRRQLESLLDEAEQLAPAR